MLLRLSRPRRRRRAELYLSVFALWLFVLWVALPYDSPVLLAARFAAQWASSLFRRPADDARWLKESPARYPVDLARDAALVLKTGYGTRARVLAQLDARALLIEPGRRGRPGSVIVVGDFAETFTHNGRRVEVHDVVAAALQHEAVAGLAPTQAVERRIEKYANVTRAIRGGDEEEAQELARAVGWELDALKFIPGLEMVYRRFPDKKWYVVQDDDTYFVKATLEAILARVDPSRPVYLGNGVGDYKGRFAHGGSGILISHAAMSRLFDRHPGVVREAHVNALTEVWGDRLVATTLLKVGVYLDERYGRFFNGERPTTTRIRPDRFCSPLASFHTLTEQARVAQVARRFKFAEEPLTWAQLWEAYGQPDLDTFERQPIRPGEDHVGETDESAVATGAGSPEACLAACGGRGKRCLAWTWDEEAQSCRMSPWMIVGEPAPGKSSGLNVPRVRALTSECAT